jgi:hypothetical protein
VIVDYKTRDESKYSFSKWIDDNYLQLGFYFWVANKVLKGNRVKGWLFDAVLGAQIIAYQTMERGRGFLLHSAEHLGGRITQVISEQESQDFLTWLESQHKYLFEKAARGDFSPQPRKPQLCLKCSWSQVCQAPHLQ